MPTLQPTPDAIANAAAALSHGELVVFPTETVYGLGADAGNEHAIRAVFERKGRPSNNPLIVHVADEAMAASIAGEWSERAAALAEAFWPGPLTLVVPAGPLISGLVTAGGATVGLRCPGHPVATALLKAFGGPLVAPSANPSGYVSPSCAQHASEHFADLMVLDGGACRVGIESTVLRVHPLEVLRPGAIGADAIQQVVGQPVAAGASEVGTSGVEASPGRLGPHYRPTTRTVVAKDSSELDDLTAAGSGRWAVIAPQCVVGSGCARCVLIDLPSDARGYAAAFYAALRQADALGLEAIVVLRPGCWTDAHDPLWEAVRERLARAATGG